MNPYEASEKYSSAITDARREYEDAIFEHAVEMQRSKNIKWITVFQHLYYGHKIDGIAVEWMIPDIDVITALRERLLWMNTIGQNDEIGDACDSEWVMRLGALTTPYSCAACGKVIIAFGRFRYEQIIREYSEDRPVCGLCLMWFKERINGPSDIEILRSMPYSAYLQTSEWKETRERKFAHVGRACQLCGSSDSQLDVHHRTYERRGAEHLNDLIVLCHECHALFHGKLPQPEVAIEAA